MGKVIRGISAQCINDALNEEIHLQLIKEGREFDYDKMQRGEHIERVKVTVLYDMGWSKRSRGTRYDSKSGHAFTVGALSKKIQLRIKRKILNEKLLGLQKRLRIKNKGYRRKEFHIRSVK